MNNNSLNRETELDILRILALLAVIMVHTCSMETHTLPVDIWDYKFLTYMGSIVTWQVPAFVLISGRFFLDPARNISLSKLWKRNILHVVIVFIVWDIVYQIFFIWEGQYSDLNIFGIISQAMEGPYHFWYLLMIVWLYAIVPFLRKITEDKRLMEYFILLFFAFEAIVSYGPYLPGAGAPIAAVLTKMNFHFVLGFSGYFILGYYIHKYGVPQKLEIPLYITGLICMLGVGFVAVYCGVHGVCQDIDFTKYLNPNTIIESTSVYAFFVLRVGKMKCKDRLSTWTSALAKYSFGVYITHALILDLMGVFGITPIMINPVIMLPIMVAICYIIANAITMLLMKVPQVGRWIV